MTSTVLSHLDVAGVRTITLNRPDRLNAMSVALIEALTAALTEAGRDPATRVIILTGAGRAFCAGDDLKDHEHPSDEAAARVVVDRIQNGRGGIITSCIQQGTVQFCGKGDQLRFQCAPLTASAAATTADVVVVVLGGHGVRAGASENMRIAVPSVQN